MINWLVFTGIVEIHSKITSVSQLTPSLIKIGVQKPVDFNDLKLGDSISVNGVCLTVQEFQTEHIFFDIGFETLKITKWDVNNLKNQTVNLERSMKFGDRIHGHFLSGHIDELGFVKNSYEKDGLWFLDVKLSSESKNYVWYKGSVGLSGVSLTVNQFEDSIVSVCLIPETQKLTNLVSFRSGDFINVEYDWMSKAFYNQIKNTNLLEKFK
jgi:riboflavin synthase